MGRRFAAVVVLMPVVVSAGCGSGGAPPPEPLPVDRPDPVSSNVWSADPGIDIFSRAAELVRVTYEAATHSFYVGAGRSFPGYAEAVGAPRGGDDSVDEKFGDLTGSERGVDSPATYFLHIVSLEQSERSVSAVVCEDDIFESPEYAGRAGKNLFFAVRIELSNGGGSVGSAGIRDDDPESGDPRAHRVPIWNVFGDWKIDAVHPISQATPDIPAACTEWWQQREPTFDRVPNSAVLASPPGWVERIMPMAVHYPEWIGPGNAQ